MAEHVVIMAADVVTALGHGLDRVWTAVKEGQCGIRPVERLPRGKYATDYAAEVPGRVEEELRMAAGQAVESRALLFALHAAQSAMDQSRGKVPEIAGSRVGLVLSTTKADLDEFEKACKGGMEKSHGLFNPFIMARRLQQELGLEGPVFSVSCACASGVAAIIQAARTINNGAADGMLVVGVDVLTDFLLSGFSSLASLSPGPCRPYDEKRDGLSLGEGGAALFLASKRMAAEHGLARIRGFAITNDATHITAPSATGEGLRRALKITLMRSGLGHEEVHYINGHGTGTLKNDVMEARAFSDTFHASRPPVSSMKGTLGHTMGAAGVLEVALCLKALEEKTVPPSLGCSQVDPEMKLPVPMTSFLPDRLEHLLSVKCGFGGVNAVLSLSRVNP